MERLLRLIDFGQSYWLDNLSRQMIQNGDLEKRVNEQGLRGITSNPSIFSKAISGSEVYDEQIRQLVDEHKAVHEIYEALTVKDVRDACDILRKVYDESDGGDGFVSLEVSPYLVHDTEGTMNEARRLFKSVNRPNCFIKIPGTTAGVPAIEQMLYEGLNINITLLFSLQSYDAVAQAYIRALQRRAEEGKSLHDIASVASFFLSRIDVLADQLLGHQVIPEKTSGNAPRPEQLFGKAAIASAKLAYQNFKKIFSGEKWENLKEKGARVQRPLWASTSTKDPLYDDVKYVNPLIGCDTVNTMPEVTISAFADHGKLEADTIEQDADEAPQVLEDLKKVGVDIDYVTWQLVNEGAQKFIDPYDKLMSNLAEERQKMLKGRTGRQSLSAGAIKSDLENAYQAVNEKQFPRRLFAKDPVLWTKDEAVAEAIRNRLGWLDTPKTFMEKVGELRDLAGKVKTDGFKHAVLLGMGGSSLCPEVARQTFGSAAGYPELIVLDNTDPAAVEAVESQIDPQSTLFIVASKSGTTTETLSFYRHFYAKLKKDRGEKAGENFLAITDPGTPLLDEAKKRNFRAWFENPQDIGGRYSAISYFGLLPMALSGIDIEKILKSANQNSLSCGPYIPAKANPGISLGVLLGMGYKRGRDKVTFILSDSIKTFGYWVEQLLAESTGKQGKGLVPVESESVGKPEVYGNDRLFVYMKVEGDQDDGTEDKIAVLEEAGHPVIKIILENKLALGAEFFRWEIATAVAGAIIGINSFDEPNVAESKQNTRDLLTEWKEKHEFSVGNPVVKGEGISVFADASGGWMANLDKSSLRSFITSFASLAGSPDYVALLSYCMRTPERFRYLQDLRHKLRDKNKVATTLGFGPRYLHSTGQLHKGGPNRGVYLLFSIDSDSEISIPGEDYDFATLQYAQALGDFRSLNNKERRVIRIHLGEDIEANLKKISEMF